MIPQQQKNDKKIKNEKREPLDHWRVNAQGYQWYQNPVSLIQQLPTRQYRSFQHFDVINSNI